MNEVVTIILTIIVFIGVIAVIYILAYNNLQAYTIKINEAESIIDELLRKKFDLLLNLQEIIIKKTDVDNKLFEPFKKVKEQNISSFDFERKLADNNNTIDQIRSDYKQLEEEKGFSNAFEDIYILNEKLEAAKAFYNKYTSLLNKLIKKFPSNIISKIHHIVLQTYFDGKDLFDENINDFKV